MALAIFIVFDLCGVIDGLIFSAIFFLIASPDSGIASKSCPACESATKRRSITLNQEIKEVLRHLSMLSSCNANLFIENK